MTEFKVTITLKPIEVSAATPAEAIAAATKQVSTDLAGSTDSAQAARLDRIKVSGFKR